VLAWPEGAAQGHGSLSETFGRERSPRPEGAQEIRCHPAPEL